MSEHCGRGHAIRGYGDVDTCCIRCMDELPVEVDSLRALLGELWADGSVRAAVGEGSDLYARIVEALR